MNSLVHLVIIGCTIRQDECIRMVNRRIEQQFMCGFCIRFTVSKSILRTITSISKKKKKNIRTIFLKFAGQHLSDTIMLNSFNPINY